MAKQYLLIFCVILFSHFVEAAHVDQVKGKRALIILDGLSAKKGQIVETINPATGKKTSFLRIRAVKGNRAVAEILRGKPVKSHQVQPRTRKAGTEQKQMPTSASKAAPSPSKSDSNFALGGLLGVGFNSMEVVIGAAPQEKVDQTGVGFSVSGAADFWLTNWMSVRGLLGIEQFNVSGDGAGNNCEGTNACETKITYFTALAFARIHLVESVWVGPGVGLQQPMTVKSNNIESDFGTTAVYGFGGGIDLKLGQNMYIPIHVEYGMQPKSDQVATSYYSGRLGIMLRY